MTSQAFASTYAALGWTPIPVPLRAKNPGRKGWEQEAYDETAFLAPCNVGVVLGNRSNGLVDIDLDCPEVVPFLDAFLPRTATFGRASKPRSHRLVISPARTTHFRDPQTRKMLLEIRSTGSQTIMPGSIHESGEAVAWEDAAPPVPIAADALRAIVARAAAGTVLGRYWPAGGRHEAQLALAGALLQEGWDESTATEFLCGVCAVAGDENRAKREGTVRTTASRIAAGERVTGWGTLAKILPADVLHAARAWLGSRDKPDGGGDFVIIDADAIFAPLPPVAWLCKPLDICAGAPTLIAGYGFSGKTIAAQATAIRVAAGGGLLWSLFPCDGESAVVHLDWEQGPRLCRARYQQLALGLGVPLEALRGRLNLVSLAGRYLDTPGAEDALMRLLDGKRLCIVDSLRAACPGIDENSSEVRRPLDAMNKISEKTGCVVILLHHARKPQKDAPGARYSIRGSGALYDACQSAMVFSKESKTEPILVQHEKARVGGITADDFALHVEEANGGLVVRAVGVPSADARVAAELAGVKERLARYVYSSGQADDDALRKVSGVSRATCDAAIGELLREGWFVNGNQGRGKALYFLKPG